MAGVNWLYPVSATSNYYLATQRGERIPVTPENVWAAIKTNPNRHESWHLSTGYRKISVDDLVWIYAGGVHQFICALGRVIHTYQDRGGDWHVVFVWDTEATAALERQPIHRSAFGQIPQSPQRANPVTARYLDRWLTKHDVRRSAWLDPAVSSEDARQKVLAEIVRRQGQPQFRKDLMANYGSRCCATGESAEAALEAAHITPYLGEKSNRPSNGLLLRADIHTLFDLHLIAIDGKGNWAVSSLLDGTSYAALRGKKPRPAKAHPPSPTELARHFKSFRP